MKTIDRRGLLGALVCGAAAGLVLAPAALHAAPIDARAGDRLANPVEKAQVVVVAPRHRHRPRRRRWVCWWNRGRRVCGWRWF